MTRRLSFPLAALATALTLMSSSAAAQDAEVSANATQSFFQMFFWSDDPMGLVFIWVLVLLSVVSVTLSIRFAMQFRRSTIMPEDTRVEIEELLSQKKYRDAIDYATSDPSFLGRVTGTALSEAPNGYGAMERAVEEAGDAETTKMLRPIELLNVLGNIAPMMGLFGTVYGMIVAFQSLVSAGGSPDPTELAAGISTALVTTLWGLVVAIPALAGYALVRNKVDALTSEALLVSEDLISTFKPSGKKSKKSSSGDKKSGSASSGSSRGDRPTPQPDA
ncbi:MAG: MotA/TolQ/ExbB proton channel family protein [Planctomycetota bacterium]